MSFDERAAPTESSRSGSSQEKAPPRNDEVVAAEHADSLTKQADISATEHAEHQQDRQACLTEHLIATGCLEEFDWNHPAIPDGLVKRLVAYEANKRITKPSYDFTKQPDVIVRKLAQRQWKYLQETSENSEIKKDQRESDQEKSSYTDFYKSLTGTTVEKLQAIADKAEEFPEEAARVASFLQIQSLAATPEDAAIVTAKINSLNFDNGIPDPVLFVQGQIFNDPDLSEATKDAIATELKVPRPALATGSDINKAMDAVDAEGNPKYTEKNPLQVRGGVDAYVKPDGSRVARVNVEGVGVREIPWERGDNGNVIGLKLSMLKIWAVNEKRGNTDFFGETVFIDTQILGQTDPDKLRKTQQVMEALLGGDAGYDGEVITDEQAEFVSWFAQYVSTKGDAAEGDFDKQAAIKNRTNLGLHPNGDITQIDYEVMREAGSFAQGQYGTGSPDYPALQKHLYEMFPEKDIPLTGENAPAETNEDS